jgi:hypothetical protein
MKLKKLMPAAVDQAMETKEASYCPNSVSAVAQMIKFGSSMQPLDKTYAHWA